MTFEPKYSLVLPSGTREGMTLYEACKALDESPERREDIAHVRHGKRPVAFWCSWRGQIRPMFGANKAERTATPDFGLPRQVRS